MKTEREKIRDSKTNKKERNQKKGEKKRGKKQKIKAKKNQRNLKKGIEKTENTPGVNDRPIALPYNLTIPYHFK